MMPDHGSPEDRRRNRALAVALTAALAVGVGVGWAVASDDSSADRASARPSSTDGPTASTGTTEAPTTAPPPETAPGEVIEEPALTPEAVEASQELTRTFLARVRDGDVDGAAALLGEDGAGTDGDAGATVAAFATEHAWLLADPDPELLVTPSPGWQVASPVVTVVVDAGDGTSRAAAFVLSDGLGAPGGPPQIQRLPAGDGPDTTPRPGAPVGPGQRVSLAAQPVEGGVRVFVDGTEVRADMSRLRLGLVGFTIPPGVDGGAVVTVSVSTPELPTATAAWYPVGAG